MERTDPPYLALDERDSLVSWLDYHRATLRLKCEGLTDQQLKRRSVPPSSMSLLGLVRHCAEVEQHWWRRTMEHLTVVPLYSTDAYPDADFDLVDDDTAEGAFAAWEGEIAHGNALLATKQLDDLGVRREEQMTLRWVLTHLIEEYARHNGHADLLRECVDGVTGE